MPISLQCSCGRQMQVKEEFAGKRIKCPHCQAVLLVAAQEPPPADEAEPEEQPAERGRRKKRRRKSGAFRSAGPLFTLFGIDFNRTMVVVFGSCLLVTIVGLVLLFTLTDAASYFSSKPDVKVVDVYTAINGIRYTEVGERLLNRNTVAYTIPGHRKIMVTRGNPEGRFLLIKFKIKHADVQKHFQGASVAVFLRSDHVELEADGEKINPLFVVDRWREPSEGYKIGYTPPRQEGSSAKLTDYIGPGLNGWTHEGTVHEDGATFRFEGKRGMVVTTDLAATDAGGSGSRAGRSKDKRPGEFIVDSPDSFINVTCDNASTVWLVAGELEQPNELGRKWEISCLFPRPKGAGKELTLRVLGIPQTAKIP